MQVSVRGCEKALRFWLPSYYLQDVVYIYKIMFLTLIIANKI